MFTLDEIAKHTGISIVTLARDAASGKLPSQSPNQHSYLNIVEYLGEDGAAKKFPLPKIQPNPRKLTISIFTASSPVQIECAGFPREKKANEPRQPRDLKILLENPSPRSAARGNRFTLKDGGPTMEPKDHTEQSHRDRAAKLREENPGMTVVESLRMTKPKSPRQEVQEELNDHRARARKLRDANPRLSVVESLRLSREVTVNELKSNFKLTHEQAERALAEGQSGEVKDLANLSHMERAARLAAARPELCSRDCRLLTKGGALNLGRPKEAADYRGESFNSIRNRLMAEDPNLSMAMASQKAKSIQLQLQTA